MKYRSKIIQKRRIKTDDVFNIMDASNISRMHLGKNPLPYLWYKLERRLLRDHAYYIRLKDMALVVDYFNATRKQRREIPYFRSNYVKTLRIAYLMGENMELAKNDPERKKRLYKIFNGDD